MEWLITEVLTRENTGWIFAFFGLSGLAFMTFVAIKLSLKIERQDNHRVRQEREVKIPPQAQYWMAYSHSPSTKPRHQ